MAMRLVPRFDQDRHARTGTILPAEHAAAMIAYWTKTATAKQLQLVATKLKEVYDDGKWIACDCTDQHGQPAENPPVMMVGTRKNENKGTTLYLFQRKERPRHAAGCPFSISEEEYERRARERDSEGEPAKAVDLDKVPNLLGDRKGKNSTASRDATPSASTGVTSDQDDPLFGVLAWLIEKSGLHCCSHEPKSLADQVAAIKQFAVSVPLEDDLTFSDLLIRGERYVLRNAYQREFKKLVAKTNADREKVGYLLFVASSIQRNEDGSTSTSVSYWVPDGAGGHKLQTETENIQCDIKYPARDGDEAKAPYLVLIRLVEKSNGEARPSKGVSQPIYDRRNLFPVDSDQERKTYRKLLQIGATYAKRGGVLQIEKPVRGRNTVLGVCRPDFIVWDADRPTPKHTIIVETMGFDTPEYQEQKARTTVLMRELGQTVIEDDRTGKTADLSSDDKLYQATMDALIRFAKET